AKRLPALVRRLLARISEDVDQLLLALLLLRRHPEADDGHAVLDEQAIGVIAEAGVEGIHLARRGHVSPQLEDTSIHLFLSLVGLFRLSRMGGDAQHAQPHDQYA